MSETCFVIMPFGKKKDVDNTEIDFDEIYEHIIQKAVSAVPGLRCERCDDIAISGEIHGRMIRHISEDLVAVVDTSTLNANVFFELGVRHALRKRVTVLIRRKGTTSPFNIAGMSTVEYTTNPAGVAEAIKTISTFIQNGLNNPANVDSLVHSVLTDLEVRTGPSRQPKPILKHERFDYALRANPEKCIGLLTGDHSEIDSIDVWVNSENSEMQMDRFYGTSTSATIRYLGARKHPTSNRVIEDSIGIALAKAMDGEKQVDPATVVPTEAGELAKTNNVKCIFHVAAVAGEPRVGYRPIERIERCVVNALKRADSKEFRDQKLKSILFPIFGTGPAGGDLKNHAELFFGAAADYLESNPSSSMTNVYFYVWSDIALEICRNVLAAPSLGKRLTAPAK